MAWEHPANQLPPFVYKVEAFDVEVFATAQSKKEAKHEACVKLIGELRLCKILWKDPSIYASGAILAQLQQQQYFADKLAKKMTTPSVRPQAPQRTATVDGNDAVEILRNFCVQHEYPLPS